jgi:hypothetical protein
MVVTAGVVSLANAVAGKSKPVPTNKVVAANKLQALLMLALNIFPFLDG